MYIYHTRILCIRIHVRNAIDISAAGGQTSHMGIRLYIYMAYMYRLGIYIYIYYYVYDIASKCINRFKGVCVCDQYIYIQEKENGGYII